MIRTSTGQPTTLLNTTVVGQPWQPHLRLGAGVDAVTGQLRASAVAPFEVRRSPSLHPEYRYALVQSESDMQSLISSSVKASYNLEGVTVSASTSYLEELAVSELAVTILAEVNVEESQFSLADAYSLAVEPGPGFRERHGDYFVAGYRAGSALQVAYQCRFTSTEQRTKFAASLGAEVPQVLSAEGSAAFEKTAKAHGANVNVRITAQGVSSPVPDAPSEGWTPGSVLSVIVPWFNQNQAMEPLESYLQAYRMIDPALPGEVPVSPDAFAQLGFLYNRFWLVRAHFRTCPDFGRRLVEEAYHKLEKTIEAHQASLATDPQQIELLTAETQRVLTTLHEIANRQAFYSQVVAAAKTEPGKGVNHDADLGTVRWGYGFQRGDEAGVDVTLETSTVSADWKIGWNEHVFSYRNSSRVIVGFDVVCNRSSNGGDWRKVSDQIIGRSGGDVFVKSDYDRGYSWTVTWYTVEARLYPAGPWTDGTVHAPDFAATFDASRVLSDDVAALELWTPELMAQATPFGVEEDPDALRLPDAPRTVAGSGAHAVHPAHVGGAASSQALGGPDVGPVTDRVPNPGTSPWKTVGKLFFRRDGQPYSGSACVVHKRGILTAAHNLTYHGVTATDLVFVPAYAAGARPFGTWAIAAGFAPQAWNVQANQIAAWDVAMCTIKPLDGKEIGEVVGWAGMLWGAVASTWIDTGYPGKARPGFAFDGEHMWRSLGSRLTEQGPATIAKLDDLTQGGSGGPWFDAQAPDVVNGLFSHWVPDGQRVTSPEFGGWVGQLFHHAFR
ncbi:serine protease [Cellulomonas sp. SLBN-39]|uniref:trypsin-like serine peptidase n=1 Tax=Cellulomonas sp. SLBN-39 TaxID=2768446 RepID=UPI00115149D9|nr:hypothetical protein [Cellulomonas sp. SLBN-39]TQL02690.1 hypothetical protein FBY24_1770 [Cellulomonas sp. SLBN-39]